MIELFSVLVESDTGGPATYVFSDADEAIAYGRKAALELARGDASDVDESDGLTFGDIYYASVGPEGDAVTITRVALDDPEWRPPTAAADGPDRIPFLARELAEAVRGTVGGVDHPPLWERSTVDAQRAAAVLLGRVDALTRALES